MVMHSTNQMKPLVQLIPQQITSQSSIPLRVNYLKKAEKRLRSPMSCYGHERPSHMSRGETHSLHMGQLTGVPLFTLEDETVFNCNFLCQLQGSYEIETEAGIDQVSVIIPAVSEEEQYAIVRSVCSDGQALPDQFIYQESNRFTLCSMDGSVKAVLRKGTNMKHSVTWEDTFDGNLTAWRRKGDVTFNLVYVDSVTSPRRSSIGIASNNDFQHNLKNQSVYASRYAVDREERAMFELIKAHCERNGSFLKKAVNWARRSCGTRLASPLDISNISRGRLWITAHAANLTDGEVIDEALQENLTNIKGAYSLVKQGVYKQPEPRINEPGVQHRLLKDPSGHWKIEAYDLDRGKWKICAKELPDSTWIDIKNSEVISVSLLPMSTILQKMGEKFAYSWQDVTKCMEFLFTSCNQKKLTSKLKSRNLELNISGLELKLEKQYALNFAVLIASTANSIAKELE